MIKLRHIILLLFPMLLVSCEKEEKVPVSMQIISVRATRMDGFKNGTDRWDASPNNSDPDPYIRIRLANSTQPWAMSAPIMRNQIGVFTFSGSLFNLQFPQEVYLVEVWDDDSLDLFEGADDFIGGYTFQPWAPGRGHPNTIVLDRPQSGIALELTVSYRF
ncbi:MAG: hypothetical protein KF852_04330 [Saprospiraceae bacterium]|nr:hypothetical protein [Saprospiraceae bacterium]